MTRPLRALAIRWMAWTTLGRLGGDGLRLVSRLILARLLWPEAFGLFALAVTIVGALELCCQLQFAAAIVQRPTLGRDLRATAHWTLAALGAAGALALLGLAGPISALLGQPPLAPLLGVLSAHVALQGLAAAPRGWLWRELGFRQMAALGMTAEAIATVAAVAAALAGAGVYALAVHILLVSLVELSLLWWLADWRPHRHWRLDEFLELVRFGSPLLVLRGVDYVTAEGDRLLIGYLFGPAALGLYAVAQRLVRGISQSVGFVFDRVAFPIFARTRDDRGRSRRGFLDALRAQAVLAVPLVSGLALTAAALVPLALGARWEGAVLFVQILAVRALVSSLRILPRAVLLAQGRQWRLLVLGATNLLASGTGWVAGIPWGPAGVATGSAIGALAPLPVALVLMRPDLPIRAAEWGRALLPAALGLAALAAGVGAGWWLVVTLGLVGTVAGAALLVAAGGAAYLAALLPLISGEVRRYRQVWREGVVAGPDLADP